MFGIVLIAVLICVAVLTFWFGDEINLWAFGKAEVNEEAERQERERITSLAKQHNVPTETNPNDSSANENTGKA